ncbi:Gfo/Idh/MocA family oxidoreductase [Actinomadura barringtoniae]|uniref:Gfo/Idh/MocA family oxidoreductase n=2 Tax=Actinomadura barringtoniae TaxID=1427535 RepID=A0A939TDE2_9ACTN|nr:Gfo/Idh/MocA family oxidoreductase [Actinomadura barringtoniae]
MANGPATGPAGGSAGGMVRGPVHGPAEGPASGRASGTAGSLAPVSAAESVDALFGAGLDGVVIAAATNAHAELVGRAIDAGISVFCEKPLASDVDGTFQTVCRAAAAGIAVQVGFQRRFDVGYQAAREAVQSGRLGWLHTVRSCSFDPSPPPPGYVPTSGGLFRDCVIHDLDSIRYVTGREVVRVMAMGGNKGDEIFRECGDVDTGTALLTLDDGTLCTASATRYNAAGYDVRLEVFGSKDSLVAGLDDRTPISAVPERSALDPRNTPYLSRGDEPPYPPRNPPYSGFLERFAAAYDAELRAFVDMLAGHRANPCPPEEALEACYLAEACELSKVEGRVVELEEVRR